MSRLVCLETVYYGLDGVEADIGGGCTDIVVRYVLRFSRENISNLRCPVRASTIQTQIVGVVLFLGKRVRFRRCRGTERFQRHALFSSRGLFVYYFYLRF